MGSVKAAEIDRMAAENGPNPTCLRDQFAAAALNGIFSYTGDLKTSSTSIAVICYEMADAMLAERAASAKSSAVAPQPYAEATAKRGDSNTSGANLSLPDSFSAAVMNWIGEATSQLTTFLEGERLTDDDRQTMIEIMGEACERCWAAHKTNHGAGAGNTFPSGSPAESQSPASECGGSAPLDDTRPDTKGEATGGRGHKSTIDVEELLRELHHIAGSEDHVEYDIRRTACEAETAIDRLRAWVNELQLSRAEIDALEYVVEKGRIASNLDYGVLRSLLIRLRPEWERLRSEGEQKSGTPKPIAQCDTRNSAVAGCETVQQEPVAWAVEHGGVLDVSFVGLDARSEAIEWCDRASDRVVPLFLHPPQDRVVRLPRHLLHHQGLTESLERAGVRWEVAERLERLHSAAPNTGGRFDE